MAHFKKNCRLILYSLEVQGKIIQKNIGHRELHQVDYFLKAGFFSSSKIRASIISMVGLTSKVYTWVVSHKLLNGKGEQVSEVSLLLTTEMT